MRKFIVMPLLFLLFACDPGTNTGDGGGEMATVYDPYSLAGTVSVVSEDLSGSENYGGRLFGNQGGTFTEAVRNRAIDGETVLDIPALLRRYDSSELTDKKSYSFASFKLVADIILKPDDYFTGSTSAATTLMAWGGDGSDLSQYIDLATGDFQTTDSPHNLCKTVYSSVLIQINAPAATIIPDFGSDSYDQSEFSWGGLKPFYSTDSSAQHVLFSTFIDEPSVMWLGVKSDGFDALPTVVEFKNRSGHDLSDFGDWAFNAVLNQEFFDEIGKLNISEDPHSGEAWLLMPMDSAIDLTQIDNVTFAFEFYMKDLLEVYEENGDYRYMLSASKNYQNSQGEQFYGPLPLRISYKSNPDGFAVEDLPQE